MSARRCALRLLLAFALAMSVGGTAAAKTFQSSNGEFTLPLPEGWRLRDNIPREMVIIGDADCLNLLRFDYIPAATLEHAKRLIETESLTITDAFHYWNDAR